MRRDTIESCQRYADERGGQCLSKHYVNGRVQMRWRCMQGHRWEAPWSSVKSQQTWCPTCAYASPYGIDDMQVFAASRGGAPDREGGAFVIMKPSILPRLFRS